MAASPHVHAGLAHLKAGNRGLAEAAFTQALAANPDDVTALQLLGALAIERGHADSAIGPLTRALALRPDDAGTLNNLACASLALGRYDDAIARFQDLLALHPAAKAAHFNLGNALQATGRFGKAAPHYMEACTQDPGHSQALSAYIHCAAMVCDWSNRAAYDDFLARAAAHQPVGAPIVLHALTDDPALHLAAARAYTARYAPPAPQPRRRVHDRIRLAYVSSDYYQTAVAHLIAGLLEDHDRAAFEVYAISASPDDHSDLRRRLERGVDRFVDIRALSDDAAAQALRDLEIDIAVDLNGHTKGNRLGIFARGVAPVQATYLGFSGTSGCAFFDYVLVDPVVTPPDQQPFYTETLWPFSDCFLPTDRHRPPPPARLTRALCGLPQTGFVFCAFNSTHKITPEMFGVWMDLLRDVPNGVLWLADGAAGAADNLRREAAARAIDPARLIFAPKVPTMTEHLDRYRLADLFLDTFPYNAATTARDALSMGLPLLTQSGRSYASRMAGSALKAAGLADLVTDSAAAYRNLALELASQPDRLAAIRARLAANAPTAVLFDADRHRHGLEAAYRAMMDRIPAPSA